MLKATSCGEVTRFDLARTIAGRGRYWTSAYLVDGLLIDTGPAFAADELLAALARTPLDRVVNTHTHEDHIGANGQLQRERGVEVGAHPLALPVLADPRGRQPLHLYRRIMWGWPQACQGRALADGQIIETPHYRFRVLYTPGHSPDHVCLYEPEQGWLFSGDLFVGGRDRALRAGYDVWGIIDSLKQVAALPCAWLFPGSARVRREPAQALADKIAYLESLGRAVLELSRRGWAPQAIAQALCGGPMFIELFTLGHFTRERLVLSYLERNEET
jgi:glyoxylase-like metal-dependent hydrolase (beta-lactamase superfamily II)